MKKVLNNTSKALGAILFSAMLVLAMAIAMPNDVLNMNATTQVEAAAKISKSSLTLTKGASQTIKVNGNSKKVIWKSTNTKVATVNSKGKITAKSAGSAKIQAKVGKKTYTCKVKVLKFKINKTSVTLTKGKTTTLKVSGTKNKATYKSSNKKIATVTSKGVIKGVKKGSTNIKVKVGKETFTVPVKVETPSMSKTSISIKKGNTYKLKLNGTSRSVKWSTNNSKVATVSNGKVTAKGIGQAIITAKVNDKSYTCKVKVGYNVINCPDTIKVKYGETKKITLTATDSFSYGSEDSSIARVSISPSYFYKGDKLTMTVTGKYVGTTNIVFKSNAGWTKKCKVTVEGNALSTSTVSNPINGLKVNSIKAYKSVKSSEHDIAVVGSFTSQIDAKVDYIALDYVFYDKNGKQIATATSYIDKPVKGKTYTDKYTKYDSGNKLNSVASVKLVGISVELDDSIVGTQRTNPTLALKNNDSSIDVKNYVMASAYGYEYDEYRTAYQFTVTNKTNDYQYYKVLFDAYDASGKLISQPNSSWNYVTSSVSPGESRTVTVSAGTLYGELKTGKISKIVLRFEKN